MCDEIKFRFNVYLRLGVRLVRCGPTAPTTATACRDALVVSVNKTKEWVRGQKLSHLTFLFCLVPTRTLFSRFDRLPLTVVDVLRPRSEIRNNSRA